MIPHDLKQILISAIQLEASDIHFELEEPFLKVRARSSYGFSEIYKGKAEGLKHPFIAILSELSGFSSARFAAPEDSRIEICLENENYTFRSSKVCTVNGCSLVLRRVRALTELINAREEDVFPAELSELLRESCLDGNGCMLFSGPTGSGKTTSIYQVLHKWIIPKHPRVLSIEDPVEYNLEGVIQSPVSDKSDWSFSTALKHFLRQDPDVLFIGEIRDQLTANLSIEAGITGHLVLSSIHAGCPHKTLLRMQQFGVPNSMMADALSLVISQRLYNCLCPNCARPPNPGWKHPLIPLECASQAGGCPECRFSGYLGKSPMYAYLKPSPSEISRFLQGNLHTFTKEQPLTESITTHLMSGQLCSAQALKFLN